MATNNSTEASVISRPGGAVAYEVSGDGPLIVCVPGIGELRSSYRFVAPILVAEGYRVALMDLRGTGDSSAGFDVYGDEATAGDVIALIEKLGSPAIIVGNSLGGGAAILVAAQRPELVSGLVLVGAYARDPKISRVTRIGLQIMAAGPWLAAAWNAYVPKLYAGRKPADFTQYREAMHAAMKQPGHAKAFSVVVRASHRAAEAALPAVTAPTLVVMGELDPDWPSPNVEARWIADHLNGDLLMVPDCGHYPQAQQPEVVGRAISAFADEMHRRA